MELRKKIIEDFSYYKNTKRFIENKNKKKSQLIKVETFFL